MPPDIDAPAAIAIIAAPTNAATVPIQPATVSRSPERDDRGQRGEHRRDRDQQRGGAAVDGALAGVEQQLVEHLPRRAEREEREHVAPLGNADTAARGHERAQEHRRDQQPAAESWPGV